MCRNLFFLMGLALGCLVRNAPAQVAPPPSADDAVRQNVTNIALRLTSSTLGGKQFWTDELVCHEWRIQRNTVTGHYRLLDDQDVRRESGTYDECQRQFDLLKKERKLAAVNGKVVICLHGLVRSRGSMEPMCDALKQRGGYTVLNVTYASTREDLASHARSLAKVISHLTEADEIHFVAHSLGNLVVRHYLADQTNVATGRQPDPRIKRMVMLGPPNQGAELARTVQNVGLFELVWGVPGQQLAGAWPHLAKRLATPTCEFGIIAGGQGDNSGRNVLIAGDDDLIVAVAETRLPGACDFLTVPVVHGGLMRDPAVQESTLRFLQHGHFVSAEKAQPISSAVQEPAP